MTRRQIHLGAFLRPNSHHVAAWRHPDAPADGALNLAHYQALVKTAERGLLDMVFLSDELTIRGEDPRRSHRIGQVSHFEPLTLLSALSVLSERVGLVATVSTTFNEPYHIARKFASLDHLSQGRAGWNLVTSTDVSEARNFGRDEHMAHGDRYERATELLGLVRTLWDSWEDDAFLRDKASGVFFDATRLHPPAHRGEHFAVQGPLNIARPPQGHPVVVLAGASEPARELAARNADVLFTAWQTLAQGQAFYADVKRRLPAHGRTADDLKILPGVSVYIGRDEAEARAYHEEFQALIHPEVGLGMIRKLFEGVDLSAYPLDGPPPPFRNDINGNKGRADLVRDLAERENLTLRQLYERIAGARGHWTVFGSPVQVADQLQEWFEGGAADGFNLLPPLLPHGLDAFVDQVVPELQRRGLFRTAYEGRTLREHLGLARPIHPARRHAAAA